MTMKTRKKRETEQTKTYREETNQEHSGRGQRQGNQGMRQRIEIGHDKRTKEHCTKNRQEMQ